VSLQSVSPAVTAGQHRVVEQPEWTWRSTRGFFQVTTARTDRYTRNGEFKRRDGFVVNGRANQLMGYAADGAG